MKKRLVLLSGVIVLIAVFYFLDLGRFLTLEGLKSNL